MQTTLERKVVDSKSDILDSLEYQIQCYMEAQRIGENSQKTVKLHEATFSSEEIMAVLKCLMENRITMGNEVKQFEYMLENYFQVSNAVTVNSGSSANLLAVSALTNRDLAKHLSPGDEVIVPALSWSTSVWPIIQMGLIPVIVDIDPETLNIDVEQIRQAISPKTKALMPIHVYGNPCDMESIVNLCNDFDLLLIEDCCEALGARYNHQYVGSFGEVGTYSLYFSHHITTLEGGFTTSNNDEIAEIMRIRRAHGWVRDTRNPQKWISQHPDIDTRFLFVDQGYNFRISEPQGAMGQVQLRKLDNFISRRRKTAQLIASRLEGNRYLNVQQETSNGEHSWFGMPITIKDNAPFNNNELRSYLKENGIETRPVICGNIAKQPALQKYTHRVHGTLQHASAVMENGFAIGTHQDVTVDDAHYIVDIIENFLSAK